jgi:hypothetical protein
MTVFAETTVALSAGNIEPGTLLPPRSEACSLFSEASAGFQLQRQALFRVSITDVMSCDLNSQLGRFTVC